MNLVIDLFFHMDQYLNTLISQHNLWVYLFVFVIIFIETGLVITPFLPGDSLIFAVGAIAAAGGSVSIPLILVLLYGAAIAGDTVNYQIGSLLRKKVQNHEHIPFVKMEYLERTQEFFARNGGKTVTIARFIPIIRTFAPFVAGVGEMRYQKFLAYNAVGGISWVTLMFSIGYFFGNISVVKNHFSLVVVAIILISLLPVAVSYIKNKIKNRPQPENATNLYKTDAFRYDSSK
jgi:membrane-associated protein